MGGFWLLLLVLVAAIGMSCTTGTEAQDSPETSAVAPTPCQANRCLRSWTPFYLLGLTSSCIKKMALTRTFVWRAD